MFKRKPRHLQFFEPICDTCPAVAVGTVTFIAEDGEHSFAACPACATDALTHPAVGTRVRFRLASNAEVTRGLLGGAA